MMSGKQYSVIPSQDLIRISERKYRKAYNTYNYSQNRVADGSFVAVYEKHLVGISSASKIPFLSQNQADECKGKRDESILIYSDKKLNGQDPEFYRSGEFHYYSQTIYDDIEC